MARGDLIFNAEAQTHADQSDVDDSLAGWGLYAEAPPAPAGPAAPAEPTFYLWPENVAAFAFWRTLQTQWRIGHAGPEGLDYSGVWSVLNNTVPFRQRKQRFGEITHLEAGALTGFAELQDERPKTQG